MSYEVLDRGQKKSVVLGKSSTAADLVEIFEKEFPGVPREVVVVYTNPMNELVVNGPKPS